MTLLARVDHMRNLSSQAGQPTIRVLYTKAGTRLSAASIAANDALVDHKAYWASARSQAEAAYLIAMINSAAVLAKVTDLQPHGQRDKRDFDNLVPLHSSFDRLAPEAVRSGKGCFQAERCSGRGLGKDNSRRSGLGSDQ